MQPKQSTPPKKANIHLWQFDVSKAIPVISTTVILLGVIRLYIYYALINVPIFQFLEFSEILTSFMRTLLTTLLAIITQLYVFALFPSATHPISHEDETPSEEARTLIKKKRKAWKSILIITLVSLGVNLFFLIYWHYSEVLLPLLGITIILMLLTFVHERSRAHPIKLVYETVLFTSVFIVFATVVWSKSYFEYIGVTKRFTTMGTKIIFNDKIRMKDGSNTFISDSTNVYYGKTRNYIITYDLTKNVANVFRNEDVLQFSLNIHEDKFLTIQ